MNSTIKLKRKFIKMFNCNRVEILKFCGTMFLVVGNKKNTKNNSNGWCDETGKRKDFEYIERTAIAHGKTIKKLIESAKEYKRLCKMTMLEYLKEGVTK